MVRMLLPFVLLLAFVPTAVPQQARQDTKAAPVQVSDEAVRTHRLTIIQAFHRGGAHLGDSVDVEVTVDEAGKVIDATTDENPSDDEQQELAKQALEQARSWKYAPFERRGHYVRAQFTEQIPVLPFEKPLAHHVPFPELKEKSLVHMSLQRTGCLGWCPIYKVEIDGSGDVTFKGQAFVLATGTHHAHISQDAVAELLHIFQQADYFSLSDSYRYPVTDYPTYTTSISIDGMTRTVTDYAGESAGMPHSVIELEENIDRLAGTARWIIGNEQTVSSLIAEGWNFKTHAAGEMLRRAAKISPSLVVTELLNAGSFPDVADEDGRTALSYAAARRNTEMVQLLLASGAFKPKQKNQALITAASAGDLEIVRILLKHNADPNARDNGRTVLMAAASSSVPEVVAQILQYRPDVNLRDERKRAALLYVGSAEALSSEIETGEEDEEGEEEDARKPDEVIQLLVKAGAHVNAQDEDGDTALHHIATALAAQALIKNGADVNLRDNDGQTPLMKAFSSEVVQVLLTAGANPEAVDNNGLSVKNYLMQHVHEYQHLQRADQTPPPD